MINKTIIVASETGNLASRIIKVLLKKELEVPVLALSTSNN